MVEVVVGDADRRQGATSRESSARSRARRVGKASKDTAAGSICLCVIERAIHYRTSRSATVDIERGGKRVLLPLVGSDMQEQGDGGDDNDDDDDDFVGRLSPFQCRIGLCSIILHTIHIYSTYHLTHSPSPPRRRQLDREPGLG